MAENRGKTTQAMRLPAQYTRFSVGQRTEHLLMMISFTGLVVTGIPQKFFDNPVSQSIILSMGGIEPTRFIHRALAILFCLEAVYHLFTIAMMIARGRLVFSMVPTKKDYRDAIAYFKFCCGDPKELLVFDRYDYRQKFEYWGVVLGGIIMISTGLVLMFPIQTTTFLPGILVPTSKEMHGGEALLAMLVIITWHLYGAHLNPLRFPGDTTIFTGKMSMERMIEEHPLELSRVTGIPLQGLQAHGREGGEEKKPESPAPIATGGKVPQTPPDKPVD